MAAAGIRNDNFFQLFNKDLATHFASTLAWVALFATVVFADSDGSSRGGDSLGVDQHVSHIVSVLLNLCVNCLLDVSLCGISGNWDT